MTGPSPLNSIPEICDRIIILSIKKLNGHDVQNEIDELRKQLQGVNIPPDIWNELYHANQEVWNEEEEIGKHALKVREWNNKRRQLKNQLKELFGGYKENIKIGPIAE